MDVFRRVVRGLPELEYADYGSRNALIGEFLLFEHWFDDYLENAEEMDEDTGDLPARFFVQEIRTKNYFGKLLSLSIEYEKGAPYERQINFVEPGDPKAGFLWWVRNPLGKVFYAQYNETAAATSRELLRVAYRCRIVYELTKIAAELRLKYKDAGKKDIMKLLSGLDSYKALDPYSGKPYLWNNEKKVLYSIGVNRKDDGGSEGYVTKVPADILLPCILHKK
ncbi:MAG: hypothetical protein GY757_16775 [bacterium]|nr:hypothetical protein [bacterium]